MTKNETLTGARDGALTVVGAYVAAPREPAKSQADTGGWDRLVQSLPNIDGLELPFNGDLYPNGIDNLLRRLNPDWRNVVTAIPAAVGLQNQNQYTGLASDDDRGRRLAIESIAHLFEQVVVLRDAAGPSFVAAVELSSAPARTQLSQTSWQSFARSLAEIAGWDWGETLLTVEHCDAAIQGQHAQKGYLTLEEEIDAVVRASSNSGRSIGQSVNWGRSAIEGRSSEYPEKQLARLVDAGTLSGLMFSGAVAVEGRYGGAWDDVHPAIAVTTDADDSLLTRDRMQRCLAIAGETTGLAYTGIKVAGPGSLVTLEDRFAPIRSTLRALTEATAGTNPSRAEESRSIHRG